MICNVSGEIYKSFVAPIIMIPVIGSQINKCKTEIGDQIVENESKSYLSEQRLVKVRVYDISDQGEEEEEGGHEDGGWVEDEGERLALLLNLFFVTESKSHFQIFIIKASRVDLMTKFLVNSDNILPLKIPFQRSDKTWTCHTCE